MSVSASNSLSSIEELRCTYCKKVFQFRQNLRRHLKNVHKISSNRNSSIKCPVAACYEVFELRSQLRDHIQQTHEKEVIMEELNFLSFEEFEIWKRKVEKEMKCCYILKQTPKRLASGDHMYYYSCFRSGSHVSETTGKRKMKCGGSRKIDGCCPSSMDVLKNEGGVTVKFWKTHFGHDMELTHLFLTNDEREEIARKLKQQVQLESILDHVRDNIDGDLERKHLLNRKDLHNVARDFHISNYGKYHNDDATSVKLWTDIMKEAGEDSPVCYYKEQGGEDPSGKLKDEDFQLIIMTKFQKHMLLKFGSDKICIDSTHGTNSYFQLTTLMVIDEFGAGCPVAFCCSDRVDEEAMKVFFDAVKLKAGQVCCQTFMSDDAPAFYNAWKCVMGPSHHQLLCTWHVDRSWRKNLAKITGKEKKALVYKAVRVLLQEQNQEKFDLLLEKFLEQAMADGDTQAFGEYFRSHYGNRTHAWAFCHRPRLGIDTNMHLESMHKTLKHFYLEGKKAKGMDKTIHMLMRLSRDKIFDRLIKFTKKVPSEKIKKIKASHQAGELIDKKSILSVSEDQWSVESSSKHKTYSVVKIKSDCKNCFLTCSECKVCVHMYECSCLDNYIHFNMCKHIHACIFHFSLGPIVQPIVSIDDEVNTIWESIVKNETKKTTKPSNLALVRKKARLICNLLEELEVDEPTCSKLSDFMDKPFSLLMNLKGSNNS